MKLQTSRKFLPVVHASTFALAMICACLAITALPVHAQTYSVLHTFTGGNDGGQPVAADCALHAATAQLQRCRANALHVCCWFCLACASAFIPPAHGGEALIAPPLCCHCCGVRATMPSACRPREN